MKGIIRGTAKRKIFIALLSLALFLSSVAVPVTYADASRDQKWKDDLNYLATNLPKLHKNLFFKLSKAEFEKDVKTLDESIPKLKDNQIIVEMMRLVAKVGDAHTGVYCGSFSYYPLTFYEYKEGLYLTQSSIENRSATGSKIVKVNGKTIDEVKKKVSEVFAFENPYEQKVNAPYYMIIPEVLEGLGLVKNIDKPTFTFVDEKGIEFDVTSKPSKEYVPLYGIPKLDTMREEDKPVTWQGKGRWYWFKYLEDKKTMFCQYNRCREDRGYPFSKFMEDLFAAMEKKPVEKFILDLSQNGGGSSIILEPLISKLAAMNEINQKDRLFVKVGRRTFSSAVLNSCSMRSRTKATFVGEPSGGKPNCYGELGGFKLPNHADVTVNYSKKYFRLVEGDPDAFYPDIPVEVTFKDYLDAKDAALEAIWAITPAPLPVKPKSRTERWTEDLDFLKTELPKNHANLFFKLKRGEFEEGIENLKKKLMVYKDSLIQCEIMKLLAKVGDPNTTIDIPLGRYPLSFFKFEDGIFLTCAPKGLEHALGLKLLKICGKPWQDAYSKVCQLIPCGNKNYMDCKFLEYITSPELLDFAKVAQSASSAKYTLVDDDGCEVEIEVEPTTEEIEFVKLPKDELPLFMQSKGNLWHEFIEESKTLYVQCLSFEQSEEKTFSDFAKQAMEITNRNDCEKLVVDLRRNHGGNVALFQPLFDAIKDSKKINSRGRLFVIVGRETLSSAVACALSFKEQTNAIIVGEPTGGGPNYFADVGNLVLPNSGFAIYYSKQFMKTVEKSDPETMYPDIIVPYYSIGMIFPYDPFLGACVDFPLPVSTHRVPFQLLTFNNLF